MIQQHLRFSIGNAKLYSDTGIFDLPAGHTCPGAKNCLARANRETGKITDGKDTRFRCYAASAEALFSAVRNLRWANLEAIKACKTLNEIVELINSNLPNTPVIRCHSSGDFFSQQYFDAWLEVAKRNKEKKFYAYTKSLKFWMKRRNEIPPNFILTASKDGKWDSLIAPFKLKFAEVVFSVAEATKKRLKIDHDDRLAQKKTGNIALLLHNTQPKGTPAAKAWYIIKKTVGGYSRKNKG